MSLWVPPSSIPAKNDGDTLTAKDLKDVIASLQDLLNGRIGNVNINTALDLSERIASFKVLLPGGTFYAADFVTGSSTVGIQEAINAASGSGSGKVMIGAGTHLPTVKITQPSNVAVEGLGMGITIVKIPNGANTILWENADTTGGNSNLTLRGITFDGNRTQQTSNTNVLLHMKRVSELRIEECEIRECRADGIYIQTATACKHVWIEDCYFHNTQSNVTSTGHAALYVFNGAGAAITQVNISDNIFENIGTDNATSGVGLDAIIVGGGAGNDSTIISRNILTSLQASGIKITNSGRADICGNWIKNAGQQNVTNGGNGIFVDTTGTGQVKINGNTIDGIPVNSDNGIEVSGLDSDVEIDGNRVRNVLNPNKNGIAVGGWNNVQFGVNHVTACAGVGIASLTDGPTSSKNLSITGAVIQACGLGGINIRGRQRFTLAGCVCTDSASGFGIQIGEGIQTSGAESTDGSISGCTATGNATHGLVIDGELVGAAGQRARRIAVAGGSYSGNAGNGIRLANVIGVSLTGVDVDGNGDDGILLSGALCSDVNIVGGSVRNHTTGGKFGIHGTATTLTRGYVDESVRFDNNTADIDTTLQPATIASAATIAIPMNGRVFHVTGTTNISNGITVDAHDIGRRVKLIFDGILTVSATGTSKLAGAMVTTAADSLVLTCDGTNWNEDSRSINA